jgi:hypothetical protein
MNWKIWKLFWPNLRLYPGINLDSIKETVKNLRQESRCLHNNSNKTPGEYQLQSSPLQSTFLVSTITNIRIWGLKRNTWTGVVKLTIVIYLDDGLIPFKISSFCLEIFHQPSHCWKLLPHSVLGISESFCISFWSIPHTQIFYLWRCF